MLGQHGGLRGLRRAAQRASTRCPSSSSDAEILAVEMEVRGILARQHGVRLRARGDQDRARRQRSCARDFVPDAVAVVVLHRHRRGRCAAPRSSTSIASGVRPSAKQDALLERLLDFLVVERVRRAVDQPRADTRSSRRPTTCSSSHDRAARALACAACALGANRASHAPGIRSAITRSSDRPRCLDGGAPLLLRRAFVAGEELLDLHRVVGERLGRRCRSR